MKRLAYLALLCAALLVLLPELTAVRVENDFAAALTLRDALENGKTTLRFRKTTPQLDPVRIDKALSSIWPYAFHLQYTMRLSGSMEVTITEERPESQAAAYAMARGLVNQCIDENMTDAEKLTALHDALVQACQYDEAATISPPEADAPTYTAAGALLNGTAVCSGYARAYQMLCTLAGLPVYTVISDEMAHSWNVVLTEDTPLYIDCTFDDPLPDQGDAVSHTYFLLTEDALSEDHTWDTAFYAALFAYLVH